MSRTAVIVALVTALLLVAAWLLLGRPAGPAAARGPVLSFNPASVIELRVRRADGAEERLVRSPDGSAWMLTTGDAAGLPVVPTRVRGMLRILADLTGEPVSGSDAADGTAVALTLEDGSTREFSIEGRPIGGLVTVVVGGAAPARYSVRADLYEALVASGPRAWRDDAAFPGIGPETARLSLQSGTNRLAIARVQGRWGLSEPIVARADPEAVVKLVGALGAIRIADFLDGKALEPASTGLDHPTAVITAESDARRIVNGETTTETTRRAVSIGGPADIGGSRVYALLDDGQRRAVVAINADAFAGIAVQPAEYLSRVAVEHAAPDIADVVIRGVDGQITRRFTRSIDGWTEPGADGDAVPVMRADAETLAKLLTLLTATRAEVVTLAAPPDVQPVGAVSFNSAEGGPEELVQLGVLGPQNSGSRLVAHTGPAWRVFAAGVGSDLLDWIAAAAGSR